MWQRIQTLFLGLLIVAMLGLLVLPIWVNQPDTPTEHQLYALHYTEKAESSKSTFYFPYSITAVLAVAAMVVSGISIKSYTNRPLQLRLGLLNSLLLLGVMICVVVFVTDLAKSQPTGQYGPGFWLIAAAVACNFLANRFIRKDQQLVKDSERLR
ncbi:MAG: DUF4293 domain-containing protein [Chryseotalea sp.]|jgi:ABC-type Fe3+-siderophore transport system permease subunit|nr:DUF4293 domain-containing protein [Flammeovirgaceae bacterium]